jgi:hypothetical protein
MPSYSREARIPGKSAQELYETVSREIERFLAKLSVGRFELDRDPGRKEVRFRASVADLALRCSDETLRLEGKLSLLALPFRSKLDEGIDRWLSKTFPSFRGGRAGEPGSRA